MSVYTTQVRWIVEEFSKELKDFPIKERIKASLPKIFNFNFPMYDEKYREQLETKIIMHYFNKEICMETVGLWQFYLDKRLNLIMPKYVEMYKTINFDYLNTINEIEEFTLNKDINGNIVDNTNSTSTDVTNTSQKGKQDIKNNSKASNDSKGYNSDFPQGNINGINYLSNSQDVETNSSQEELQNMNNENSSNMNNNKSQNSNTNTTKIDNEKQSYTRKRKGYSGKSITELNMEYRNSILNIDKMIVDELYDLFMLIY